MARKVVNIYPVSGGEIRVGTKHKVVVLRLPYFTGIGTPEQQEHLDHAYCLMPEQATNLRDSLTAALKQIGGA
jgi:hypothetical protein